VFVEARKSTGIEVAEPTEPELEVGLERDREGGLIGFSELKKLAPRFRTAGEAGIFCSVSMVRSDKDGRDFRTSNWYVCSSSTGDASSFTASSSSALESSRIGCSRKTVLEGFLKSALPLGFLCSRLEGGSTCDPVEGSRSRAKIRDSRLAGVVGTGGLEGMEADSCSRDAEGRRRGLLIESRGACRLSLDAAGRRVGGGAGFGNLEGLGMPDGLAPEVEGSMIANVFASK
jgi:hypothetical protein